MPKQTPEDRKNIIQSGILLLWTLMCVVAILTFVLVSRNQQNENNETAQQSPEGASTSSVQKQPPVNALQAQRQFGKESPSQTLLEIIGLLKEKQDPTILLDYIWWDAAFGILSEAQKKTFSVTNPSNLRRTYQEYFTNPAMLMIRETAKRIDNLPAEKKADLIEFLRSQEKVSVPPPRLTDIQNQLFEIKRQRIHDSDAEIELLITKNGKSQTKTIHFLRIGKVWMLECFQILDDPYHLCSEF